MKASTVLLSNLETRLATATAAADAARVVYGNALADEAEQSTRGSASVRKAREQLEKARTLVEDTTAAIEAARTRQEASESAERRTAVKAARQSSQRPGPTERRHGHRSADRSERA